VNDGFPDLTMTLFAPNPGNSYTDLMLLKAAGESNALNRVDTELDDDPLYRAAATANVEGALTYMSWLEYQQVLSNNQANIQLVSVDGGNGCVSPTQATIADGSYPLSRPVQLLINQSALARIEVMSFIWYLIADENYVSLEDAGFIGLSFADLANARSSLQTAYNEASAAAREAEATAEPGVELTAEPEATGESTAEAEAEATEASGS
jgi:phosphate transport system substrate-binding protein